MTTDPKQSFRSSLHSLQMGTKSSSPVEAEPLVIAIKIWLQKYVRNRFFWEIANRRYGVDNSPHSVADKLSKLINNLFCGYATTRNVEDPILEFL